MKRLLVIFLLVSSVFAQSSKQNFGFELESRYVSGAVGYNDSYCISDNNLYILYGNTLAIFNLENHERFEQLGFVSLPGNEYNEPIYRKLILEDEICTLIGQYDGLHVTKVNVLDPSNPQIISANRYEPTWSYDDARFDRNYIYRSKGDSLFIDSLTATDNIINIAKLSMPPNPHLNHYANDRVVMGSNNVLYFIDVSDRYNPSLVDSLTLEGDSSPRLDICGDYLLLSHEDAPSKIIDISANGSFQTLHEFPDVEYFHNPAVLGDTLYALVVKQDSVSLDIIDLSTPFSPDVLNSTAIGDVPYIGAPGYHASVLGLTFDDGCAVLGGGFLKKTDHGDGSYSVGPVEDGLKYFDLSDPTNPIEFETQRGMSMQMEQIDDHLLLSGLPANIINVLNPSDPSYAGGLSGSYGSFWNPGTYDAGCLYVCDDSNIITCLNASDLFNPFPIGRFSLPNPNNSWFQPLVRDSIVYLSIGDTLYTIDFHTPAQAKLTSKLHTGRLRHFKGSNHGNLIYGVVDDEYILTLIDLSSPTNPKISGTFQSEAVNYVVDGDVGFSLGWSGIHDGSQTIQRLDLSDPQNIVELGSFLTGPEMWSDEELLFDGSFLYVYSMGSLEVFDVSAPGQEIRIGRHNCTVSWPAMFWGGSGIRDVIVKDGTVYLLSDMDGLHILSHSTTTTTIDDIEIQPKLFNLSQNYPNPFNPSTTISYELPELADVNLTIYDVTGREVITLENKERATGHYEVQWNGVDGSGNPVSTSVYFARLQAGDYSKTIKMVYLK